MRGSNRPSLRLEARAWQVPRLGNGSPDHLLNGFPDWLRVGVLATSETCAYETQLSER